MAVTYPGAAYRQLPGKSTTLLTPRIINVHTMVWWLSACEDYFRRTGNPYSHFGTGYDGEVRQWQDLRFRAASCLNGNPFSISIENADKGTGFPAWTGSNVPRFTPAQAWALAKLIAWLCVRFNIPPYLLNDSLPGRVGPSYHRLGIDPWRVSGGVLYSSAYGKVCPGDRRIAQLRDEIMPLVRELISSPTPIPRPPEDDMPNWVYGSRVPDTTKPYLFADGTTLSPLVDAQDVLEVLGRPNVFPQALSTADYDSKLASTGLTDRDIAAMEQYLAGTHTFLSQLRDMSAEELALLAQIANQEPEPVPPSPTS